MENMGQFYQILEKGTTGTIMDDRDRAVLTELNVIERWYPANSTIISQGDWSNNIYLIREGWGCIHRVLPDGGRHILDIALCGDLAGFRAPLGINYKAFAAITDISLYEFSIDNLTQVILKSPHLSMLLLEKVARQRAILMERFINVGRRTAAVRIIHLLLELGLRSEVKELEDGAVQYFCPLTQSDIADALGLTTIHVNRMLRELRERELLLFRNNEVVLLNRPVLMQMANFDANYLMAEMFPRVHFKL